MPAPKGNKYAVGKGGRPRKFQSVEDLQRQIDAYFEECDDNEELPTVTGLALTLDTSRRLLCNYETGKYDDDSVQFSDTIKKAKSRIQQAWHDTAEKRKSEDLKIKALVEEIRRRRSRPYFKSPLFP